MATLSATTELQAVNAMLATIGESPVASLSSPPLDVQMAQNALNNALRSTLSRRWRFNTEYGYGLSVAGTYTDGGTTYNVFTAPSDLAGFNLTRTPAQADKDVILRQSRDYSPTSMIFADRLNARDGWEDDTLLIDPVWFIDYEYCPESARQYVLTRATRAFQAQTLGSEILIPVTIDDEEKALQALTEDQKEAAPLATGGVPQTETEAVNLLLTAAGQEPIIDIDRPVGRAASQAVNVLRTVEKTVLSQRWRFNTESGYSLSPDSTYDASGTTMNVFNVPTGLATFQLTQNAAQRNLDALQRPSRETPGNQIIANRLTGEDGWTLDTLSIDPVWLRDFADCPSYMRQYISLVAARKYLGSAEEIPGFTAEDEQRALLEVHRAERQIAPVTTGTARTTEVEAVNSILDTAGLAPVGSLDSILTPEASRATNLLREAVRELCTEGWEFNTEHGYEITSADSYEWTNSFNETYTLNVFTVPADLLNFDITTVDFQQGPYYLDLAARQSREYTDAQGDAVQLFADRATNRDGHLNRDAIYINPVWLFPFDQLPEEARRFAVVLATRRFAGDRSPFNRRDELIARRTLQRAYGTKDAYTLLDNQSVRRILGGRSPGPAGAYDRRATGG